MKGILFVFVSLIFVAIAAGQITYCHPCQKMISELRERFHNDFKHVQVRQIIEVMIQECYADMPDSSRALCRMHVKDNAAKLLRSLRNNATNNRACIALEFCSD